MHGIHIDTEWRLTGSGRVLPHVSPLQGRYVLDGLRQRLPPLAHGWGGRNWRSCTDPSPLFLCQFEAICHFCRQRPARPPAAARYPGAAGSAGPLTLSLHGVLYHRKSPSSTIEQLRNQLKDDGGAGASRPWWWTATVKPGADALRSLRVRCRNVWFSLERGPHTLGRALRVPPMCASSTRIATSTDEQRRTDWMINESLRTI